jgi:predicted nucleic acid-binding protein
LREQFGTILIPEAVARELGALTFAEARAGVNAALANQWIEVRKVEQEAMVQLLSAGLHLGESEAIALACETKATWTLLDEREARATAQRMNLKITGVLGVLLRAKQQARLVSLAQEMERLRSVAHFFIAPALEKKILQLAGE